MKRLIICQSTKKECKAQITTNQPKGKIIFCNGCKRNFVEDST